MAFLLIRKPCYLFVTLCAFATGDNIFTFYKLI
jgi:hypothetical protein